jgi:hypothetical protein
MESGRTDGLLPPDGLLAPDGVVGPEGSHGAAAAPMMARAERKMDLVSCILTE